MLSDAEIVQKQSILPITIEKAEELLKKYEGDHVNAILEASGEIINEKNTKNNNSASMTDNETLLKLEELRNIVDQKDALLEKILKSQKNNS